MEKHVDETTKMYERSVDVLIVGAGPVGLVIAYQLAKFGGISVAIIEKHAKSMQDAYGRAITLYPRTSEMLDQLGLAEELAQQCFACRETVAYNAKGEEVHGRGWSFMDDMHHDTNWGFALVLRQKYQEEVLRKSMKAYGIEVESPVELMSVAVEERISAGGMRITATIKDERISATGTMKCRYLIGSDGGRSTVRKLFGIPFEGAATTDKWARIDGLLKTDLPKPRTYCAIESPTHGNVLWAALDRGTTRIGYAFTADRANAHENFDERAAVEEAIAAVKPFHIEFERVDWWTIYAVGQRVAKSFFVKDCVFLAGDACHTHSSGAAQGENTGIHDAVNLAWKLALVLKSQAKIDLLHTYELERMPNVHRLINYDRDISRLMTNRLPQDWQGDPDADVSVVLGRLMKEAGAFSSGLGIFYDSQDANFVSIEGSMSAGDGLDSVRPGKRAPDVTLLRPATFVPSTLIKETPNDATFYILLFVGTVDGTGEAPVYHGVQASSLLKNLEQKGCLGFLTVLARKASSAYEILQHEPLGRVFFDDEAHSAHKRYGIDVSSGGIVVLRPDGWIGTMLLLSTYSVHELERYFDRIFLVR